MEITFKSFNSQIIKLFIEHRLMPLVSSLGLEGFSGVGLPANKRLYTMNKSPHVFSKAKEQFALKTFIYIVRIPTQRNALFKFSKFERLLKNNLVTGLSLQIKIGV